MDDDRGIEAVRRGHAPNCSATGSVVGLALVTATAASAVVCAFADRFWQWADDGDGEAPRIRRERRGSILAWPFPAALLRLNERATRAAIDAGARPIGGNRAPDGALSAPVEVHVAVTDSCPVRCADCYLDAGPEGTGRIEDLDARLAELAELGVFEIALGGGEGLVSDPEGLLATAVRIRELGMVPNLTTSGFGMTAELARRLAVMGQVNVSLDGLGEVYRASRGFDASSTALRAIDHLVAAGVRVGVNTVIRKGNVDHLGQLATVLSERGVSEWQWLRLKPAGRAAEGYADRVLSEEQALALWPRLLELEARTGLTLRIDCAMVPFLVAHGPPIEALERLAISGCPGGIGLWSIGADGATAPCSFAHESGSHGGALAEQWHSDPTLRAWRDRAEDPPEPCGSCPVRHVCRGGCRIVAQAVTGDPLAPDPECPRVRAWRG